MARRWLWFSGFEFGQLCRGGTNPNFMAEDEAHWLSGWSVANPQAGSRLAGGDYHIYRPQIDAASNFTGHLVARAKAWIVWHWPITFEGFLNPAAHAAGDDYTMARFTPVGAGPPAALPYLGGGFQVGPAPALNTVQVTAIGFTAAHAFQGAGSPFIVDPVVYAANPGVWINCATAYNPVTGMAYLFVDGRVNGPVAVPVGWGVQYAEGAMLYDDRHAAGKGAEAGNPTRNDDWGACDADTIPGDEPPTNPAAPAALIGCVRMGAMRDIDTQWPNTAEALHWRSVNCKNRGAGCPAGICPYIQAAVAAQRDSVGFGGAYGITQGTVEGIRLVWDQRAVALGPPPLHHPPHIRLTGQPWTVYANNYAGYSGHRASAPFICPAGAADAEIFGFTQVAQPTTGLPWTTAAANMIEAGFDADPAAPTREVGEVYVMAMGSNLLSADVPCPIAAVGPPVGSHQFM